MRYIYFLAICLFFSRGGYTMELPFDVIPLLSKNTDQNIILFPQDFPEELTTHIISFLDDDLPTLLLLARHKPLPRICAQRIEDAHYCYMIAQRANMYRLESTVYASDDDPQGAIKICQARNDFLYKIEHFMQTCVADTHVKTMWDDAKNVQRALSTGIVPRIYNTVPQALDKYVAHTSNIRERYCQACMRPSDINNYLRLRIYVLRLLFHKLR